MTASTHGSHEMIEWLHDSEADVARVGGKAASLMRLARLGFRIPSGFCLTTVAYATQTASLPGTETLRTDPAALLHEPTRLALVEAIDRKSTRLNSSHLRLSRMPSSA